MENQETQKAKSGSMGLAMIISLLVGGFFSMVTAAYWLGNWHNSVSSGYLGIARAVDILCGIVGGGIVALVLSLPIISQHWDKEGYMAGTLRIGFWFGLVFGLATGYIFKACGGYSFVVFGLGIIFLFGGTRASCYRGRNRAFSLVTAVSFSITVATLTGIMAGFAAQLLVLLECAIIIFIIAGLSALALAPLDALKQQLNARDPQPPATLAQGVVHNPTTQNEAGVIRGNTP